MAAKCPTPRARGYPSSKAAVTGIYPGFVNTGISGRAITANGVKREKQIADEANGMPVETCAQLIIKAVEKRKHEAIMLAWCKSLPWINLIAPRTFEKMAQKSRKVD